MTSFTYNVSGVLADLVDDGEDGVDQHQVVFLERQVFGLLQSKQHRPHQGDLGGALHKRTMLKGKTIEHTVIRNNSVDDVVNT